MPTIYCLLTDQCIYIAEDGTRNKKKKKQIHAHIVTYIQTPQRTIPTQ